MPYVKQVHRTKLDPLIEEVCSELAELALPLEKAEAIGAIYYSAFLKIATSIRTLASGDAVEPSFPPYIERLAKEIFKVGTEDGNSFWAGDLNYSLTRIIQLVPKKLVEKQKWKKEFRYWVYAVTAGALEGTALEIMQDHDAKSSSSEWLDIALIGVLIDVKDEYKRRVNAPYEEEQIKLNGDCYDAKI